MLIQLKNRYNQESYHYGRDFKTIDVDELTHQLNQLEWNPDQFQNADTMVEKLNDNITRLINRFDSHHSNRVVIWSIWLSVFEVRFEIADGGVTKDCVVFQCNILKTDLLQKISCLPAATVKPKANVTDASANTVANSSDTDSKEVRCCNRFNYEIIEAIVPIQNDHQTLVSYAMKLKIKWNHMKWQIQCLQN